MIEKDFDITFIANLALREKQIQQNYRPVIAVHKWFARRPGTLFRGLLLSEFAEESLKKTFYKANCFSGLHVVDPFMGGGIPILEANRIGCDVTGFDINPMSYWIVKQEIEHLDLEAYTKAADALRSALDYEIGHLYRTSCELCGAQDAHVKYFLWVKVKSCDYCEQEIDLFPGYLVSADVRHPINVFVCANCGELTETIDRQNPGRCHYCSSVLVLEGPAKRGRCKCSHCKTDNSFPTVGSNPPRQRLFAIEYHCPKCKKNHKGRFFKKPDSLDIERIENTEKKFASMRTRFIPADKIPTGDETNRLHRWGYRYYYEMFNVRQLVALELSARLISKISEKRIHDALATNLSDLLRYQNMLCRYDTRVLKSLDIFSIHGFPVGLVQCESNFLGITQAGRNMCVGSGGWANIIAKYKKAKSYCDHPFEVKFQGHKKNLIHIDGEWIGDHTNENQSKQTRLVNISCKDAATSELPNASLDAVFTDPPYFGNVQYAELMDFCYVWLRKLVGENSEYFSTRSTRNPQELTGNKDMGRGVSHFTEGLSSIFQRMAKALKPGSPLAFTYHHNNIEIYYPVAVAILDSGMTCSASLPCPAEMGGSIHINGTGSSIIDTIFVCRTTGTTQRKWLANSPDEVARIVENDLKSLRAGNVQPTKGDTKCIVYGHLIRLAIWSLRLKWDKNESTTSRIAKIDSWLRKFGEWTEVEKNLVNTNIAVKDVSLSAIHEKSVEYGTKYADISF